MDKNAYRKKDARLVDGVFQLPHRCDEWIIGDADNAKLLIEDLKALIKQYREPTPCKHRFPRMVQYETPRCVKCGIEQPHS